MAKAISDEKRADIIRHIEAGKSRAEIAEWHFVCIHTVCRIWVKYKRSGSYKPEPRNSGRKPMVSKETMDMVVSKIREVPDMTLLELIDEFDLPFSQQALSKRLIKLGFTFKKNATPKRAESPGRYRGEGRMAVRPKRNGRGKYVLA
jgi:transposase